MPEFTIQIQAGGDGDIWQGLHPAETVTAATAQDAAGFTAANQTIADGGTWRVVVWAGADADTGATPAMITYRYDDERQDDQRA